MKNAPPFISSFLSSLAVVGSVAWLGSGLAVLTPVAAVAAELYKCAGDGGVPTYQNMPCDKGKELRNLSGDDTLSVVPMRVEPSRLPPPPPPLIAPPAAAPSPISPAPPIAPDAAARTQTPSSTNTSTGAPAAAAALDNVPSTPLLPLSGTPGATAAGEPPSTAAAARMAIKPGMTAAEVEAKLGPPPMTGNPGSTASDQSVRWFYLPTEGDRDVITTVILQHGKVTNVERKPMKN